MKLKKKLKKEKGDWIVEGLNWKTHKKPNKRKKNQYFNI